MSTPTDGMHNMNDTAPGGSPARANAAGHNGCELFHAADSAGPDTDDGTDMAGRRPGDGGHNPFDTKGVNAKHAEDAKYGSAQAATVIGGLYAAEHGKARGSSRRARAGTTRWRHSAGIQAASAKDAGLIDHIPSEADVVRWYRRRHVGATGEGQRYPRRAQGCDQGPRSRAQHSADDHRHARRPGSAMGSGSV